MNYTKIYDSIIDRAKIENRKKNKELYYEKHHIIPKCLGGNNDKSNLVLLTAREHYICHKLLCFIHPHNNKLKYALWAICTITNGKRNNKFVLNSKEYEHVRIQFKKLLEERHSNTCYEKIFTKEVKLKMKKARAKYKKPIDAYNIINNKIYIYKSYESMFEASNDLKIHSTIISNIVAKKRKSYKGFTFVLKGENCDYKPSLMQRNMERFYKNSE